jgi:hypothetical protein
VSYISHQRQIEGLLQQFSEQFNPDRIVAITALEKEVNILWHNFTTPFDRVMLQISVLNGEVDHLQAYMHTSDRCQLVALHPIGLIT